MAKRSVAPTWAWLVLSDLHLNRGPVLSNGKPNRLEDFRSDHRFAKMVEAFASRYPMPELLRDGSTTKLTVCLNGDTIDFMAIPHKGRYRAVPTVEGALDKFQQAFDGHMIFFRALAVFLSLPRPTEVVVSTHGNHDPEFFLKEVQERFLALMAGLGADPARIRFANESELPDGVLVIHGAEFDPWCRPPPDDQKIIVDKEADGKLLVAALVALAAYLYGVRPISVLFFGLKEWSLGNIALAALAFIPWLLMLNWVGSNIYFRWFARDRKSLNLPYSYYMHAGLGMAIKRHFLPWISRMEDHGPIWALTLARDWHYAVAIVPMLLVHVCYDMFFVNFLSARRRANLRAVIGNLKGTMRADRIADEAAGFLRGRPSVRRVVFGHTHAAGVQTLPVDGRDVALFNTGTGVEQIRMVKPAGSFFGRVLFHWRHAPPAAVFFTAVHLGLIGAVYGAADAFGWRLGGWGVFMTALVVFLLILRQSYALYRGEAFTQLTPCEIRGYTDEDVEVELFRFEDSGEFVPFLDPK